jgi:hypothetical protein
MRRRVGGADEQNMQEDLTLGFLHRKVAEMQATCSDLVMKTRHFRKSKGERKGEIAALPSASWHLSDENLSLREEIAGLRVQQDGVRADLATVGRTGQKQESARAQAVRQNTRLISQMNNFPITGAFFHKPLIQFCSTTIQARFRLLIACWRISAGMNHFFHTFILSWPHESRTNLHALSAVSRPSFSWERMTSMLTQASSSSQIIASLFTDVMSGYFQHKSLECFMTGSPKAAMTKKGPMIISEAESSISESRLNGSLHFGHFTGESLQQFKLERVAEETFQ